MPLPYTSAKHVSDTLAKKWHLGPGPAKESYNKLFGKKLIDALVEAMPQLRTNLEHLICALEEDESWLVFEHLGGKLYKLHSVLRHLNKRSPDKNSPLIPLALVDRVDRLSDRALELKKKHGDGSYADPGADDSEEEAIDTAPLSRGTKRQSQDDDESPRKGRVLAGSDGDWRAPATEVPTEVLFRHAREYIASSGKSSGAEAIAYNAAIALRTQIHGLNAQVSTLSAVSKKLSTEYDSRVAGLRSLMEDRPSAFPKFKKTAVPPTAPVEPKVALPKPASSSRSSTERGARMTTGPAPKQLTAARPTPAAASTTKSSKPLKNAKATDTAGPTKTAEATPETTSTSSEKGKGREVESAADEDVDMLDMEPIGSWDDEMVAHDRRAAKSDGEEAVSCGEEEGSDVPKGHHSS
ncbi:hypothetical protein DFP72DRAFT_1177468 [Ephemerocybe angulata]|uniref:Uncharacterized protein n=1 Tax=Ephemerocybe angulata TaxID=980116 RepID=A0A8H6LVQ5_9AGAR|nr:hypothetical protein DFP72DRAFT_1177468 [Tulosesus angulatus]